MALSGAEDARSLWPRTGSAPSQLQEAGALPVEGPPEDTHAAPLLPDAPSPESSFQSDRYCTFFSLNLVPVGRRIGTRS